LILQKKPVEIGTGECCLKNGSKKGCKNSGALASAVGKNAIGLEPSVLAAKVLERLKFKPAIKDAQ